jgi:hypothetical protein
MQTLWLCQTLQSAECPFPVFSPILGLQLSNIGYSKPTLRELERRERRHIIMQIVTETEMNFPTLGP